MATRLTTRRGFLLGSAACLTGLALAQPRGVAAAAQQAPPAPAAVPFSWRFKRLLWQTAQSCVQEEGFWLVPSSAYGSYYTRDSFWLLAALQDRALSAEAVRKLAADQRDNADGHIATSLERDGSRPEHRDHDDESSLLFVLHNLLLARLGGEPDREALARVLSFVEAHVHDGKYVAWGEKRSGAEGPLGAYHYWADTFRPAGRAEAREAVFTYNQGLYALALNALRELGLGSRVPTEALAAAEAAYASLTHPGDGQTLVQAAGSTNLDVSALVGEALSLYFYNRSLLGRERVAATLAHLPAVHFPGGAFLGYKVLSKDNGEYLAQSDFFASLSNTPGNYHNGGSWLLYDALALYAGQFHGVQQAAALFRQRLEAEVRLSWDSHEYISTSVATLGGAERFRDGYAWNAFVLNLLPWDGYYAALPL
ncbi:MAG: hypothetical protein ACYC4L_15720 [Chloroflexota bacterium]